MIRRTSRLGTARALIGRSDFLYVADCKLGTREQMQHIDSHRGRFVTVLPRSRKEDRFLRDWTHTDTPEWTEADHGEVFQAKLRSSMVVRLDVGIEGGVRKKK